MTKKRLMDYYEEEEIAVSLRRVAFLFWSALAVGVLALLLITGNSLIDSILTILFTCYFAFLATVVISYHSTALLIIKAYRDSSEKEPVKKANIEQIYDEKIEHALDAWVERKAYLSKDQSVCEIANEFGMNPQQLHQFFYDNIGIEFRDWRTRLRVEEAERILKKDKKTPTFEVAERSGFNDTGYFNHVFKKLKGMSVSEFRKSIP